MVQPRLVRNTLSGSNLGHPVHPMLTDLPIGAWSAAVLLDTVGGSPSRHDADVMIVAGMLPAAPAVLSGLNGWPGAYGPKSRLGFVHAAANTAALALYRASFAARTRGRHTAGRTLRIGATGAPTLS
jgi:uncharacterized membrane protein